MNLYRLTAVTKDGTGFDHSWGDTYEVAAASYDEARKDVLGREGSDGKQHYTRIVKAWIKGEGGTWLNIEVEDPPVISLPFPEMPRTRTVTQTVPDHEVLLVFSDDTTAERFSDWLDTLGWPAFTAWHAEMDAEMRSRE